MNQNIFILKYKVEDNKKYIKLFGNNFVYENKDKCKIEVNDKQKQINQFYRIEDNLKELEIKIIGNNNITNMSYMFEECDTLLELSDISQWNTSKVVDMSNMFNQCKSLYSLPDISKWNTSNVIYMNSIFKGCKSLSSLPDISQWNTSKVTNINEIFNGCKSLSSLPDISKWNTSNVINISYMFFLCKTYHYYLIFLNGILQMLLI